MIIDTSALVAILDQEPEAERIARTLAATPERMLSAANLVEVKRALEFTGVESIDENGGGPGVRLRNLLLLTSTARTSVLS